MKTHKATIGQIEVSSRYPYIVYGDVRSFVAQCRTVRVAERALKADRAGCKAQGGYSDAHVYEWDEARGWRQCVDYDGRLSNEYADEVTR